MKAVTIARIGLAAAILVLVAGVGYFGLPFAGSVSRGADKPDLLDLKTGPIPVRARRISFDRGNPARTQFGALTFRGGVVLSSSSPYFGGFSGLEMSPDGRALTAISDSGSWLTADVAYDGRIVKGLSHARMGQLRALGGKPLDDARARDAESMVWAPSRRAAYISFEEWHRIGVFPVTKDGFGAPSRYLTLPKEMRRMSANVGLEALTVLAAGPAKGGLLAISENYRDEAGHIVAWILGGAAPGRFTVRQHDGYSITDATTLPGGDVVILERRFRFTDGIRMRLRRIPANAIKPGAIVDGDVLLTASQTYNIDNMECLSVHTGADGETVLTLMSDDNFSLLQRTVVLQFTLGGDGNVRRSRSLPAPQAPSPSQPRHGA